MRDKQLLVESIPIIKGGLAYELWSSKTKNLRGVRDNLGPPGGRWHVETQGVAPRPAFVGALVDGI